MFKKLLRRILPVEIYNTLAKNVKRIKSVVASAVASIMLAVFQILPVRVLVELKSRLNIIKKLDYRRVDIQLNVSSLTELDLRLKSCQKEPETIEWLSGSLKPGSILYDIGANVGAYSLIAAKLHEDISVFAFEPVAETYASLVRNITLNNVLNNVSPLPVALSDNKGVVKFFYSGMEAGAARHLGLKGSSGNNFTNVVSIPLDDICTEYQLPKPTHIKIDVDGAELLVVKGGLELLKTGCVESMLIEMDSLETDCEEMLRMLSAVGYVVTATYPRGDDTTNNYIFGKAVSQSTAQAEKQGVV